MDISTILPLLLGKGDLGDKTKLFSMLTGGKKPEEILSSGLPPEMSGIINAMSANKKTRGTTATGLGVITPFAPAEIIGALVKFLNAV